MIFKIILTAFAFFTIDVSFCQQTMLTQIEKLNEKPLEIHYHNALKIQNTGGHLQGIQSMLYNESQYYVLSGSSSEYAYYAIAKSGEENMVITINKILDKPFKHAGGFQIHENLMAIGVEDNDAKNISKVFLFYLENPEKPPKEPLAIIDRMGTFKRATAGCVGIVTIRGKVIVVVGDWDTEHLDFYRIDKEKLFQEGAILELEYSINTRKMDKSSWIDESWLSYQNINFIIDELDNLLLAGMTSNGKGENVLDLYVVASSNDLTSFALNKVKSFIFPPNDQTKFRWGAGTYIDQKNNISILSCGENIKQESIIHIYQID